MKKLFFFFFVCACSQPNPNGVDIVVEPRLSEEYFNNWQDSGTDFIPIAKTIYANKLDYGCGEFYFVSHKKDNGVFLVCCIPRDNKYNWYKVNTEENTLNYITYDSTIKTPR